MWIDHVLNPKTITHIYPVHAPSLAQVRLQELTILCGDDLRCRLRVDLPDFPADAPAKWVQQHYNTVQLTLSLLQATIDYCAIPNGNGRGDLTIKYEENRFEVAFHTQVQGSVFRATATWIQIDNVAGYFNGPDY
jgi:hypothetical protein